MNPRVASAVPVLRSRELVRGGVCSHRLQASRTTLDPWGDTSAVASCSDHRIGCAACSATLLRDRAFWLQVVDKAGSAPYLLRQLYQRHLLRFQAVSSSLESTARQKRRHAHPADGSSSGKRPASAAQSAAEEAAVILGSLTGTNGLTPEEYISAVAPSQPVVEQVALLAFLQQPEPDTGQSPPPTLALSH